MILADFRCPSHGAFELLADSDDDTAPCPTCSSPSPWQPSPVFGRVEFVTATRGRSDAPPSRLAMSTRTLGEGQSYGEWRAGRKKMWRDHDWKQRKDRA